MNMTHLVKAKLVLNIKKTFKIRDSTHGLSDHLSKAANIKLSKTMRATIETDSNQTVST